MSQSDAFLKSPHKFRPYAIRVFAIMGAGIAGLLIYYFMHDVAYVVTDNAYVGVEVARIDASITANVHTIHVYDTQYVKAGTMLVSLDPADNMLAIKKADADLAMAVVKRDRARKTYMRRQALSKTGAVSEEELTNALYSYEAEEASVRALDVVKQQVQLERQRLNIVSPVDGVVVRRQVQLGSRVQPGSVLMSVVPIHNVHVDANFKESQLTHVRVGQKALLTSDYYGPSVRYEGVVTGIAGGSGAAFSLIPAQNATGNWIKVVQRVPVRIALKPEQLRTHPLRVGLSMTVRIETADSSIS